MFSNKILLITGGTGSFGNAVLNRFLNTDIKEIRIFSRDEKKQDDMRKKFKNNKIKFIIGDIRNFDSINFAMRNVDYVFHAAALKQVPSCEFNPIEAVRTNILGAENVLNAAIINNVKKVIALSTDKAVYPINAMGISKCMMEKLVTAKARDIGKSNTVFCCTRYGNVMASRGSVIPFFIDRIKQDKDLTLTDPNMTRFLMSLDEAVDLVLYAFENGEQGDILVKKAPASTVNDLAIALKEIFNSRVGMRVIGIRHGEKLHETLIGKEEMLKAQEKEYYFKISADCRDLNYDKNMRVDNIIDISKVKEYTSENTMRLNVEQIKQILLKIDYVKQQIKG